MQDLTPNLLESKIQRPDPIGLDVAQARQVRITDDFCERQLVLDLQIVGIAGAVDIGRNVGVVVEG